MFKTGSGSVVSMGLGAVASKIMAVTIGPAGIGLYSMLIQVNSSASLFGTAGGSSALVQGTASREGHPRESYLITVFWIFITAGVITSIAVVGLAPWIAQSVLGEASVSDIWLIRWLALPIILSVILSYLSGVLNGFRAIGRLAMVPVVTAAVNAGLAFPVSHFVKIGYPIAFIGLMSLMNAAGIAVCLIFAKRKGWLSPIRARGFRPFIEMDSARHFFLIAATTAVTTVFGSVILLVIRSLIVGNSGLSGAGIFNVAWTFGFTYAMLYLGAFGTYYFPTLSLTHEKQARIDLMRKMFRVSTLLVAPLLVAAILLKPLAVQLLYSNDFLESLQTWRWLLIGDYFKTASWVMAMSIIAYADMKTFLWTEVSWWSGFLVLSAISIQGYGEMQGVGLAYLVLYVAYLVYVFHYARSRHGLTLTNRSVATWFIGLILVGLSSWQTWNATSIDWITLAPWLLAIFAFVWLSLLPAEREGLRKMLLLNGRTGAS